MAKFNEFIKSELFRMIVGKKIGEGAHRKVFEHNYDDSIVIKIEQASKSFSNIKEYEIWQQVQYSNLAKWFAPVIDISPCGSILLMKKIEPVKIEELPLKIPTFFTDLKKKNWGRYGENIVCCDYGNILINCNNAIKKAEWHDC